MIYYKTEKQKDGLWICEDHYDPVYARKTESVFAQCNGYMGVRASHALPTLNDQRGMFVAGVFNRAYEEEVTELVNCPDITSVEIKAGGEQLSPDVQKPENYERKFHPYTGELRESYICTIRNGLSLRIETERFASAADRHLFVQRVSVTPLNGDIDAGELVTGIDGRQTNSGVSHFQKVECRVYDKMFMEVTGYLADDKVSVLVYCTDHAPDAETMEFTLKRRSIFGKRRFSVKQGETYVFEKYAFVQKQDDAQSPEYRRNVLQASKEQGYDRTYELHRDEMKKLWNIAEIDIRGARPEEEAAILFAQYHLMGMMPWQTDSCSIAAKGLTGEGYKGHAFWDTEIFMLPFFQYNFPEAARKLLEYRYHGLDGARQKADAYGYRGAMYPWETAKTGEEETPLYAALNIHTGRANKVWSGVKEHHVTADIAYAVCRYFDMTGDWDFMEKYGCEILFETAEFWSSRVRYDEGKEMYVIEDVIGPDEYTEHVDNNAYTNYMAQLCISMALRTYADIEKNHRKLYEELDRRLEIGHKVKNWKEVRDKMFIPGPGEDGIIPQDDTFLKKPMIPDIDKYRNAPVKQAVLLDYSRDEVVDMQVLKQADVVMLLNLFPHWFDPDVIKKNVLFYEERTIHDSSLSYCAHAQACASIGEMELAWKFFEKCMGIDLDENPNDSAEGIHSASLGGIWNCVIFGFAGVSFENGCLYLEPRLPEHWEGMKFNLCIKGERIHIEIDHEHVEIVKEAGQEIRIQVCGSGYTLKDRLCISYPLEKTEKAVIFDLDGVVVDTAKYHYLAWKKLAEELGFVFEEKHNERLKGVSRMRSLEIVLEVGGIEGLTQEEKERLATRKNGYYLEMISSIDQSEILPGIPEFLGKIKNAGYKIALGSASKSGRMILEKLKLDTQFDEIVDGNLVERAKPDPQVFTKAAELLNVPYGQCIVVEDSAAGIEAAKAGGMKSIGIGKKEILGMADVVIPDTSSLPALELMI